MGFDALHKVAQKGCRKALVDVVNMGSVDPAAAGGVDPYGGDAQQTLDGPAPHGHSLHIAVGHRPVALHQHTARDLYAPGSQRIAMPSTGAVGTVIPN